MNRLIALAAIAFTAFHGYAQEAPLPSSLTIATKESLQKLEDKKQQDIAFYAKNNISTDEAPTAGHDDNSFYKHYIKDDDNRYYNNYHDNNADPILTNMPSPGPNLDYYFVDPCSSGNYDKVVSK
ncbi:hypothetical protein [uncultured Flavobacterium sp.]|uniref:hypothetical protein n=1 Tax=uncultured Flavobacterium sp. TaxID=165435 RepID=UPI0025E6AE97|nr:hypothetical protein [uncultured Flavobacterium sp.]